MDPKYIYVRTKPEVYNDMWQVLVATQTPGEDGMKWFQGTADAVCHFDWHFEVLNYAFMSSYNSLICTLLYLKISNGFMELHN